jgi:hypothetical protein
MKTRDRTIFRYLLAVVVPLLTHQTLCRGEEPLFAPRIDGPWWTVSGDPDLGEWTSERQQPVDFGVWQAGDGTWQLWSCIRNTPRSRHFIGTAESIRGGPDDAQVGVIESPVFTIDADRVVLQVSGGKDRRDTYVTVLEAETGDEIVRFAGNDDNTFCECPLEKTQYADKQLRIRVVDNATDGWGHINFGGVFVLRSQ